MDPISQGALGAALATSFPRGASLRQAALLGAMSGMAPDLDVLIQSPTDPLLFLEFHRQFTHALVFIPVGAAICAVLGYYLLRRRLAFGYCYFSCLLGYATHALLDSCTSYGTQLFWPFSNTRVDWCNVSVVDPLFTLPLLLLLGFALARRVNAQQGRYWAMVGMVWVFGYLGLGVVQRERAEAVAYELAAQRNLAVDRLEVKPAFANLLLWRVITEADANYYVDAVRVGLDSRVFPGSVAQKLDLAKHFPTLQAGTQQARDVERFRWFSQDFLALDPTQPRRIIDVRYATVPNDISGMWSVVVRDNLPVDEHIAYETIRRVDDASTRRFGEMLWPD